MKRGGEEVPYDVDTVVEYAQEPRYREFYKDVMAIAQDEENFREVSVAELGEDLPTT